MVTLLGDRSCAPTRAAVRSKKHEMIALVAAAVFLIGVSFQLSNLTLKIGGVPAGAVKEM
jgi:hypothetical protein